MSSNLAHYKKPELDIDFNNPESMFDDSRRAMAAQEYKVGGNNEWAAHRVWSGIGKGDKIHWAFPGKTEEGEERHSEILPIPAHHFVGFIGLPLQAQYGFSQTEGEAGNSKIICQTSRLEYSAGQDSRVVEGNMPLDFPIAQIHQSKKAPHNLTYQLNDKPNIKLFGSRPPVGEDPDNPSGELRSCRSCVEAGEHYKGTLEEFTSGKQIPSCKMQGQATFVIFKLGIQNVEGILNGTGAVTVDWVDVKDANLRLQDGSPLDRPFILTIRGMGKMQHWSIGAGEYNRNIIRSGNGCYLPREVYSWGDYYKLMHKRETFKTLKNGDIGYLQGTACYIAKLSKTEYGQDYMPVFSPVTLDNPALALAIGLTLDQYEKASVNGMAKPEPYQGGWPKVLELDGSEETPTAQVAPASQEQPEEKLKTTSSIPSASTWDKKQLGAFQP